MSFLLIVCGATAALVGAWRSYALAREALAPIVHAGDGDPTRSAIDATRPLILRSRVRRVATAIFGSLAWLAVAMYGAFLIVRASELPPG